MNRQHTQADILCLFLVESILNLKTIIQVSAFLAWTAFLAWALMICYLSSLTQADLQVMPKDLLNYDKLVHAVAFAVGAACLGIALHRTNNWLGIKLFIATLVGIGLFGAFDEIHQLYSPGRSGADFYDWVADMIGGSLAALVYCFVYGKRGKNISDKPSGSSDSD